MGTLSIRWMAVESQQLCLFHWILRYENLIHRKFVRLIKYWSNFFVRLFFFRTAKSIIVQLAGMANCPYHIRCLITSKWQRIRISICTSCHGAATAIEIHIISVHPSTCFTLTFKLSEIKFSSAWHCTNLHQLFFVSSEMRYKETKNPQPSRNEEMKIKEETYRFLQTKCVCSTDGEKIQT